MKKSYSPQYKESCHILRLIRGDIKRDYLINYDFHKPENWYPVYTKQKMAALDKRITALIKCLDENVKPRKDDMDKAVPYFVSGIISSVINYETLKIKEEQGIFVTRPNDKRDFRKSFYHVLYILEGNLSYFSDRWCYERVFSFTMYWAFVKSAFKEYQYSLKNTHHNV
jgi:hypothetical protein